MEFSPQWKRDEDIDQKRTKEERACPLKPRSFYVAASFCRRGKVGEPCAWERIVDEECKAHCAENKRCEIDDEIATSQGAMNH